MCERKETTSQFFVFALELVLEEAGLGMVDIAVGMDGCLVLLQCAVGLDHPDRIGGMLAQA